MNYSLSIIEKGLLAANELSAAYGLMLTAEQAAMVAAAKRDALRSAGRIEFSTGLERRLVSVFCDSPYIEQADYADTLCELFEIFYDNKNALDDGFPEDELIDWMAESFNGRCGGSLEALRLLKPMERPQPPAEPEDVDE